MRDGAGRGLPSRSPAHRSLLQYVSVATLALTVRFRPVMTLRSIRITSCGPNRRTSFNNPRTRRPDLRPSLSRTRRTGARFAHGRPGSSSSGGRGPPRGTPGRAGPRRGGRARCPPGGTAALEKRTTVRVRRRAAGEARTQVLGQVDEPELGVVEGQGRSRVEGPVDEDAGTPCALAALAVLSWTRMISRASRSNSSRSASGVPQHRALRPSPLHVALPGAGAPSSGEQATSFQLGPFDLPALVTFRFNG